NACGEEVGSTFEISVKDTISVPTINADEIGICHDESTADITLDRRPGETVFYHLYDAENINSSLDSVYAGVDEIVFQNLIQGKYFVRAQDIKSECFSAYTDTIFVQPYLTEADTLGYETMFWEDLIPDFNTIEYMSDGDFTQNIDMDVLDSVNSGIFDSYSVVQFHNPSVRFDIDNRGDFTITEGNDDYIVAGKYADECALYPITKNWLHVMEDQLEAHTAYLYLGENEMSDTVTVQVTKTPIDVNLDYFFVESEKESLDEEDLWTATIDNEGLVTFTRSASFFGTDTIRYGVENIDIPGRYDESVIIVFSGNIDLIEDKTLFIPNAISPNGDGLNDEFVITSNLSSIDQSTLEVFNRWGSIVYQSEDTKYGKNGNWWNGKANISNMVTIGDELPNGVYFYVYTIKANVDGETVIKKFNGFVELRR
ncbi:MAG: hypothetical protein PWR04_954, partial [Anaerophaga sp.]|nr:hypothetical protein [Anaerophaga sp.]